MVSRPQINTNDVVEAGLPPIVWVTREEANRQFDEMARERVGMSGPEFLRRLDNGEFDGISEIEENIVYEELMFMSALGR